jgi:hypothetical protein
MPPPDFRAADEDRRRDRVPPPLVEEPVVRLVPEGERRVATG